MAADSEEIQGAVEKGVPKYIWYVMTEEFCNTR